jgi:hypothetical protein
MKNQFKGMVASIFVFSVIYVCFSPGKAVGAERGPENIQRNTPAGQDFPGSGSGPGSRSDQLVGADEMKLSTETPSSSGNVPDAIQRNAPAGQDFPGPGGGPGNRSESLTGMEEVPSMENQTASGEQHIPQNIQRSTPSGQKFPGPGSGPGSRNPELVDPEKS